MLSAERDHKAEYEGQNRHQVQVPVVAEEGGQIGGHVAPVRLRYIWDPFL